MSIAETCPTCGHSTNLTTADVKEFSGEGFALSVAPVADMPKTLAEMVDGIIERSGYGG